MDLLYSRYASPLEFMNIYIENGRFGEFVEKIVEMDFKRKQEKVNEDNENKLWSAYIHSNTDTSFNEWKKKVLKTPDENKKPCGDENLTDADIEGIINGLFEK